jgi:hypothetical protein
MDKPRCRLIGKNGNVFNLIAIVTATLKKADMADKAKEFMEKAWHAGSYDNVLVLIMDYVEVM